MDAIRTARASAALIVLALFASRPAWLTAEQAALPATQTPAPVVGKPANDDDLVTAGRTIRVTKEITGDVAAAGSEITIDAPVDGYVMTAGRRLTLVGQ